MERLVDERGRISWGIYSEPVQDLNYLDYDLRTPMGARVPRLLKRVMANKFHFVGIVDSALIAGIAIVDLTYLSSAFFYIYNRRTKEIIETKAVTPLGLHTEIRTTPENPWSSYRAGGITVTMTRELVEASSPDMHLLIKLDQENASPLRICTRAGYTGWVYTQKTSPVRIEGSASVKGQTFPLASPSSMALIDWTCGYMRRQTCWNWAATAFTLPDGRTLGMNLSCGVNETSFTENAFWLDGVMTKVDLVNFIFDPDDILRPWHIASSDGRVELSFTPEAQRNEKINAFFIASRFTQLVGTFDGTVKALDGTTVRIQGCPGFAEDHYARW